MPNVISSIATGGSFDPATGSRPTGQSKDEQCNAEKQQQFKLAWDAYTGKLAKPLRVRRNQPDDNVRVNPCRLIVNKGVAFLFGKEVQFQLDGDDQQTSPAEEWLNACWKQNKKMVLLQKLAVNGAVYGHAFVQIVPDPTGKKYPRLINLDPTTVEVTTAPDDVERVTQYKIQFNLNANLLYRKLITPTDESGATWTITEQQKEVGAQDWVTTSTNLWPYAWPPIVDCQNLFTPNEYWGQPDLNEDLIDLNRSMNFTLSNLARIIRVHGHPKQWASGMDGQSIKMAVDETLIVPKDAKLGLLEVNPAGLAPSLDYYTRLKEAFHEMAAIPEIATGKVENVGQLSGIALAILYQPLIELTGAKRLTYGDMLNTLNVRLLELAGKEVDEDAASVTWPELLPRDMLIERQAIQIDNLLGLVSKETMSDKLGYNFELEAERKAQEAIEEQEAQAEAQKEEKAETPQDELRESGEEEEAGNEDDETGKRAVVAGK